MQLPPAVHLGEALERCLGAQVNGVEAVSFPIEDKCQDLMEKGLVQKAQLDKLPFPVRSPPLELIL